MENYSRKEFHKRQKKKKIKKEKTKSSWIGKTVAIVLTLGIVGGAAYVGYDYIQKEDDAKAYEEKSLALLTEQEKELASSGIPLTEEKTGTDDKPVVTFLPKEMTQDTWKTQLAELISQGEKYLGEKRGTVTGYISMKPVTDQLTEIRPVATVYTWNQKKKSFTEKVFQPEEIAYVNQTTQQAITASDLFATRADLLGMFNVMQQKILDQSGKGAEIIDSVLNMERPTIETLSFTYAADHLTVHLGENDFGVSDVDIPFGELSGYVNPSFVDPTLLTVQPALDPNKKYISLTFDDGPNAVTTPQLLATLKEKGVKATFFSLGENAAENPDILKQIVADGHELANHTYNHAVLSDLTPEEVAKEVRDTSKVLYLATGKLPRYVRPPYGAVKADIAEAIGLPAIQWNVDSDDWELKNAELIKNKVVRASGSGTIVLIHDIHQESVDSVGGIIDELQAQGFEFISIEQMLGVTKPLNQYFGLFNGTVDTRAIQ
ncbi:polysaccharide deacetylase family protein [Enterococcus timonensis]|uniref:polysaccharide deacetylase family protein n=1 Tax=Enterococcus timonensis TaxID=1852364 RepID=UPI0008DB2F28|nr:polysaccharide deacetylase family protein [Enterococcus timonensis]